MRLYFGFLLGLLCVVYSVHADENLKEVLSVLNSKGYDAGIPDGAWGPRTRKALTEFLKSQGQDLDGTFSANEYEAIAGKKLVQKKAPALFQMSGNKFCEGYTDLGSYFKVITRDTTGPKGPAPFISSLNAAIGDYLEAKYNKERRFRDKSHIADIQKFTDDLAVAAKKELSHNSIFQRKLEKTQLTGKLNY